MFPVRGLTATLIVNPRLAGEENIVGLAAISSRVDRVRSGIGFALAERRAKPSLTSGCRAAGSFPVPD